MPYQGRNLAYGIDPLPGPETLKDLMGIMAKLYRLFITLDCSLAEINPLVITKDGKVMAIDAKITIDDNGLVRQKELATLDDPREKDPLEAKAIKHNLSYIRLNGNIGAMVNGAGLAMATMDVIKLAGAEPANFWTSGVGQARRWSPGVSKSFWKTKRQGYPDKHFRWHLSAMFYPGVSLRPRRVIKVPIKGSRGPMEEGERSESSLKFTSQDIAEAAEMVTKQVSLQGAKCLC
jgi:hypothetical protein